MENLVKIKPLSSDNYNMRCQDIKVLLKDRDEWEITQGTEILEETYEKRQFASWRNRVFSTISLIINETYRLLLQDKEKPRDVWEVLKIQFLPNSRAWIVGLIDQFFKWRIEPGEEIGLYGARLQNLVTKLNKRGKKPGDWHHAFQLIRSLPTEFSAIVQAIYRWDDKKFTPVYISKELVTKEAQLKQYRKEEDSEFHFIKENKSISYAQYIHA